MVPATAAAAAGKATAVAVAPAVVAGFTVRQIRLVVAWCCWQRLLPWWSRWEAAAAAMVRVAVYDCGLPRRWLPAADDEVGGVGRAVVVGSGVVMMDLSRVVGLRWCGGGVGGCGCMALRVVDRETGNNFGVRQKSRRKNIRQRRPAAAGREWWPAAD
uniref:Uncharacterized protein n=1 Tax=Tanacetum cinerariifolium TaxID=118510 RepID=A0A699L878_TANCI|nr:hypothetical protein [Tanacetum cinerariifolium]